MEPHWQRHTWGEGKSSVERDRRGPQDPPRIRERHRFRSRSERETVRPQELRAGIFFRKAASGVCPWLRVGTNLVASSIMD